MSDYGTPDGRPIGHGQALLLRYVKDNPGCSVAEANGRNNPYGRSYTDRAWALYHRGLLNIDTGRSNRYRLTITADGEQALAVFLHRAARPNCTDDCCARKASQRQPSLRQLIDRAEYLPPGYAEREALIDELGPLVAKQITRFVRNAPQGSPCTPKCEVARQHGTQDFVAGSRPSRWWLSWGDVEVLFRRMDDVQPAGAGHAPQGAR